MKYQRPSTMRPCTFDGQRKVVAFKEVLELLQESFTRFLRHTLESEVYSFDTAILGQEFVEERPTDQVMLSILARY
jgi:hypothetical protein